MDYITGVGLSFYPLYWVHHDSWIFYPGNGDPPRYHWGHLHWFMLGYTWKDDNSDAFTGSQSFQFDIKDLWGPRSLDPNQSLPYTIVGTPKWYWNIEEIWRRVYIQKWDERVVIADNAVIIGRRGIRWDACDPAKTLGPFREGNQYAPVFMHPSRTLPIEYFKDNNKTQDARDNLVSDKAKSLIDAWNAGPYGEIFPKTYDPSYYNLNFGYETPNIPTYPDALYIYPTIEYQKVTQLNWERMPTWEGLHDKDATNFGDGWSNAVTVPFINPATQTYNSPFGPLPGVVTPIGQYFGTHTDGSDLVDPTKRPMHRIRSDGPPSPAPVNYPGGSDYLMEPFGLPAFKDNYSQWNDYLGFPLPHDSRPNLSGTPMAFADPYGGDGKWVQQCIGGMVQVKAEVTLQHKLGGQSTVWVQAVQLLPSVPFAGTDQDLKPV
jgi:hypothetical protein